ncbi:MAG TPA: glycosyltransferase [Opitutaceae bacterium]|nr:glycosyltransferase [Opitutaceae bacterium]
MPASTANLSRREHATAGGRQKMRSLVVSSCFPPNGWGGAEIAAEGIAKWMAANGHEVAVYTDSGPAHAPGESQDAWGRRYSPRKGWWNHRAGEHGRQSGPRKAFWHLLDHAPFQGYSEFARAVADFKPDLVMVHLAPGLGIGIFEYCARHDVPVVFVVHDFWMTCLRSSMFSRGGTVCTRREFYCRWSSAIRWGALSRVPRLGFWAVSRSIVEVIEKELGVALGNVLIERNIVDLSDFAGASQARTEGPPSFLYVGKVTAAKGVDFALGCLSGLPGGLDFRVDVVGSGDLELPLRRQFDGDPRFRFHGARSREEVGGFYRRASALLVPSIWFENSPIVIYQAQAAGLPVIGSDSGGIPELLAGRDDSFVLPAGDRAQWTSKLRMVAEDRELLARLAAAGARHAAEGRDALDSRAGRVMDFCRSVMNPLHSAAGPR